MNTDFSKNETQNPGCSGRDFFPFVWDLKSDADFARAQRVRFSVLRADDERTGIVERFTDRRIRAGRRVYGHGASQTVQPHSVSRKQSFLLPGAQRVVERLKGVQDGRRKRGTRGRLGQIGQSARDAIQLGMGGAVEAQVDPDADDDQSGRIRRRDHRFGQDAAQLAVIQKYIIDPLDRGGQAAQAFDRLADRTLLVTAPLEVRLSRVMARDGVSSEVARSWMRLQMDEEEKARRADIILDNTDSPDLSVIDSLLQLRQ